MFQVLEDSSYINFISMKKARNLLKYKKGRQPQNAVKYQYLKWRMQQNPALPERCDIPACVFYTQPLVWNGKNLRLILDHINGVCGDNRIKNLRLLCPNCNSQQSTQGGGNKGKVVQSSGGFSIKDKSTSRIDYTLPAEAGTFIFGK